MNKDASPLYVKTVKEILQELGCSFKSIGQSHVLDCPKCGKKEKLYVRKTDGRFVCWSCKEINNFSGKIEYLIPHLSEMSLEQAKRWIRDETEPLLNPNSFQVRLIDFLNEDEEQEIEEVVFPEEVTYPRDYVDIDSEGGIPGAKYLESRGIPVRIAKKYEIMYSPYEKRVVFPVKKGGILVGWQGRLIEDVTYVDSSGVEKKAAKAKTSSGMKKSELLMFGDRIQPGGDVIICEGPIDAIKCDFCPATAIATFGKSVSEDQVQSIVALGVKNAYIALDPDAESEADDLKRRLELLGVPCKRLLPPNQFKDLGEMSFDEVLSEFRALNDSNLLHFRVRLQNT